MYILHICFAIRNFGSGSMEDDDTKRAMFSNNYTSMPSSPTENPKVLLHSLSLVNQCNINICKQSHAFSRSMTGVFIPSFQPD